MNVTVIIPVYNAEQFLAEAVESAIGHEEVKEIVLVEDGSPDDSLSICLALEVQHARVKLYRHKNGVNKGAGASRNLGIQMATQEYICFLDADDIMTEFRFKQEAILHSTYSDADGFYGATGVQYHDESGAQSWMAKGLDEMHITTVEKPVLPEKLFDFLIGLDGRTGNSGYFTIDALILKRESLIKSGIKFEDLNLHEDTIFIWKCAYYLKLVAGELKRPVALRRVHKGNRYITHEDIHSSRAKQFKSLLDWAQEEGLKKEYINLFVGNYLFNHLARQKGIGSLGEKIYQFFRNKYFRTLFLYDIYTVVFKKS